MTTLLILSSFDLNFVDNRFDSINKNSIANFTNCRFESLVISSLYSFEYN